MYTVNLGVTAPSTCGIVRSMEQRDEAAYNGYTILPFPGSNTQWYACPDGVSAPTSIGQTTVAAPSSQCSKALGFTMRNAMMARGLTSAYPTGAVNEWWMCPAGVVPPTVGSVQPSDATQGFNVGLLNNYINLVEKTMGSRVAVSSDVAQAYDTRFDAANAAAAEAGAFDPLQWATDNWQYLAAGAGVIFLVAILSR